VNKTRMTKRRKAAVPETTRVKRLFYGLLGAAIGAVVGYGLVTSGPLPPGGRDPMLVLMWSGGLAVVCGAIAAGNPAGFWRPKGGWMRR
jgi:hypothetical protein